MTNTGNAIISTTRIGAEVALVTYADGSVRKVALSPVSLVKIFDAVPARPEPAPVAVPTVSYRKESVLV